MDELERTVVGYQIVSDVKNSFKVKDCKVKYALLPVWMLSTNWNGKNFLFAMNGQTGRLVGDLPVDKKRYFAWLAAIALPIMAILTGLLLM